MLSISLDCIDEVGNQVGTSLVLVEYFGPCCIDGFIFCLKLIVTAGTESENCQNYQEFSENVFHGKLFYETVV